MPIGARTHQPYQTQTGDQLIVSKNVAMFVDVANIYYAARGQDVDVDYVALLKHATKGRDLVRAYAYSGLDPENENQRKFIDFLGKNGYKVLTKDIRKFGDGRVKANLDIELVVDLFRLADRMDIAVIVSGDGDFAPAIRALQDKGVRCEVISFKPNTSSDLIAVADEFFDIQKILGIGRKKDEKGMAAPEMPAKEVVPEFGFREASPTVAAAALAALKGGAVAPRTNGRSRRGRRPAEEAPAPTASAESSAATEEERRRRRRRRGGRGRGRGRAEAPAGPAEAGETAWEELDDLSQLEGLGEEREYTFADADEDTLRELGVLDAGSAAETAAKGRDEASEEAAVAEPAEEAPSRAGRGRRRKAAEPAAAGATSATKPRAARGTRRAAKPDAGDEAAAKPKAVRARRTSAKPSAGSSAEDQEGSGGSEGTKAEAKPRRRSRSASSRASSSSDAPGATESEGGADEAQPQGIWGRFRSGRGSGSTRGG
jgi:uncharacterized LabA/DUF88 family protein